MELNTPKSRTGPNQNLGTMIHHQVELIVTVEWHTGKKSCFIVLFCFNHMIYNLVFFFFTKIRNFGYHG